jgi:hypothetical protein
MEIHHNFGCSYTTGAVRVGTLRSAEPSENHCIRKGLMDNHEPNEYQKHGDYRTRL